MPKAQARAPHRHHEISRRPGAPNVDDRRFDRGRRGGAGGQRSSRIAVCGQQVRAVPASRGPQSHPRLLCGQATCFGSCYFRHRPCDGSRRHKLMIFLDSSGPKEIKDISAWGILSGITTNPLIIAKEGGNVDLETRIKEVIEVSHGDVSVELTTETEKAMMDEAAKYHAWNPNRICIKVPFGEIGLRVLHSLATRGVRTNVTCMMSFNQ